MNVVAEKNVWMRGDHSRAPLGQASDRYVEIGISNMRYGDSLISTIFAYMYGCLVRLPGIWGASTWSRHVDWPSAQRMFVPSSYRCSRQPQAKQSSPQFGLPETPACGRFWASGLAFPFQNDTEILSPIGVLSPRAWESMDLLYKLFPLFDQCLHDLQRL
jgi:hypothetical protein